MSNPVVQLERELRRLDVCGHATLLAVSGGADSVALLLAVVELAPRLDMRLHLAHLDHGLRAEESTADAAWIGELAARLGVPATIATENVSATAAADGIGIEEAARNARYAFLARVAREVECTHVATAHTADDQAETILHHILRGTGLAGLRGIPATRPLDGGLVLIRPLLDVSRKEIEVFLAERGQDWRDDSTNSETLHTRNRLRHELLPLLEREYNPRIRDALRKLGRQAEEAQLVIDLAATELLHDVIVDRGIVDRGDEAIRLNCDGLHDQPRHLIRACFAQLWRETGWSRRGMGFTDWERLVEIAISGGAATLPGAIEARCRGKLLMLRRR